MLKINNKPSFLQLFKYNFASIVLTIAILSGVVSVSALVSSNRTKDAALREITIPKNLNGVVGLGDIRAAVLKDAPNANIVGIELEQEDEGLIYKVKLADRSIRLYDARTGKPIAISDGNDQAEFAPTGLSVSLNVQQARDHAQRQRPGELISKIELQLEDNRLVYSARFTDGGRVDVDANNGAIVRVEGASNSGRDRVTDAAIEDNSGPSMQSGSNIDDNSGSNSDRNNNFDDSGSDDSGQSGGSDSKF